MLKQHLINIKRTVIPNGEKEKVRFGIACKEYESYLLFTGKQHEITMEATVFNPSQNYTLYAFFPDIYEIVPVGESLDSFVTDSFNPDSNAHYRRKSEFSKIIPELSTSKSGVAFQELKSNAIKQYENRSVYELKLIAARSNYNVTDAKEDLPIVIVLSDLKTDELRHFNKGFRIKTENTDIKIISKSAENSGNQDENLFWNQPDIPHRKLFNNVCV